MSAYEQINVSPWTGGEVLDGASGNALEFSIQESEETERGSIIDIRYFDTSNYSGSVRMRAPEPNGNLDLSEYATGVLRFDLKVLQESLDGTDLELSIDCGWPCGNTPIYIRPNAVNQWQTFEISVQELIEKGLDIKKVDFGFSLYPTWAKQKGAHYQLDNIRWIKGEPETSTKEVCYSNFFDTRWISGVEGPGVAERASGMTSLGVTTGVNPFAKINPNWATIPNSWTISFSEAISYVTGDFLKPSTLSSCSGSGEITFDIFTSKALVDDATMSFSVHFMDEDSNIFEIPGSLQLVADMTPDDWNRITVNLPPRTPYENLQYVGLTISSASLSAGSDAYFYVDNIRIVKSLQTESSSSSSAVSISSTSSSVASSFSSSNASSLSSVVSSASSVGLSSTASSSISSVASSSSSISDQAFVLFDDEVKNGVLGAWIDYENVADGADGHYFDGSVSSHVRWELIDSQELSRGKIIEVTFNASDASDLKKDNGWFGVSVDSLNSRVDLSDYINGALSFDMRIVQQGAIPENLVAKMECGYPCSARWHPLQEPDQLGEWKNYQIPVKTLVDSGLDITKVDNIFMIYPNWFLQFGQYVVQIDNVKISKTFIAPPKVIPVKPLVDQIYNVDTAGYKFSVICDDPCQTIITTQDTSVSPPGQMFDVKFTAETTAAILVEPVDTTKIYSRLDMSNYYHGYLVFDLKVTDYGFSSAEFIASAASDPSYAPSAYRIFREINCSPCLDTSPSRSIVNASKEVTFADYRIPAALPTGEWITYRIPVKDLVEGGLILDKVYSPFYIRFTRNVTPLFQMGVRNIRWEYKAAE